MKKFLVAIISVLCLAGCGAAESNKNSSNEISENKTAQTTTTQDNQSVKDIPEEPTTENDVMYNQNDISITYKGISNDSILGPGIKLLIENNSDKPMTVQGHSFSVNGFAIDLASFLTTLEPGKKSNEIVVFVQNELDRNDITSLENVEFKISGFSIQKGERYFDSDAITIGF